MLYVPAGPILAAIVAGATATIRLGTVINFHHDIRTQAALPLLFFLAGQRLAERVGAFGAPPAHEIGSPPVP